MTLAVFFLATQKADGWLPTRVTCSTMGCAGHSCKQHLLSMIAQQFLKLKEHKKKIVLVEQFAHLQRRGECVAEIVMQDG